jgi:carbamoyl-phosphate synthase large subunit
MIGADYDAIQCAEDREKFQAALQEIGVDMARSVSAHSLGEAREIAEQLGYPVLIRPSFTMGGAGASVAYNAEEFDDCAQLGRI